jgi:hypothetical protein
VLRPIDRECGFARCARPGVPSLIVRVPANERGLEPVTEARRAAFEAHLSLVIAEALAGARPELEELSFLADPLVAAVCAVCAGACCLNGGDRAYLDARTLARFFAEHPDASPAVAVDAYLAHVGPEAYVRGCIFQSARGCTLPRPLRADLCRTFECASLRAATRRIAGEPTRRALVLASDDAGRVVRLAIVADDAQAAPSGDAPTG